MMDRKRRIGAGGLWGGAASLERREAMVTVFTFVVFGTAAVLLAVVSSAHNPGVSRVRHFGAAVTFWSALQGAYYFSVTQALAVARWFHGLSLAFLGLVVCLSLAVLTSHSSLVRHAILIHVVLLVYVIWDLVAMSYYKKRAGASYRIYRRFTAHDVLFAIVYGLVAYVPLLPDAARFVLGAAWDRTTASDSITLFVLAYEFVDFSRLSLPSVLRVSTDVLDVRNGYTEWAPIYEKGNAIIATERLHTARQLKRLSIEGKAVVDFGCGTGYYLGYLLDAGARRVIGVDQNAEMIRRVSERIKGDSRLELVQGGMTAIALMNRGSIDAVLACLVVDHLEDADYLEFIKASAGALKQNGLLYISDVNPYYEQLTHRYASFLDASGIEARIRVYPHSISWTLARLREGGFEAQIREELVTSSLSEEWEELQKLVGFPLITSYLARRN
jgi:SAM-dependent methyltransferase